MYPMMPISTEHTLSLHTIKALKENFDYSVAIISIGSGILIPDFQKYGPVYCLEQGYQTEEKVELLIKDLLSQNFTSPYVALS